MRKHIRWNFELYLGLAACVVLGFFFIACEHNVAPEPDSDSQQNYDGGQIPVDDNIYVIRGTVQDVNSLVRQVAPAQGSVSVINGVGSGSFIGEQQAGKGFVRVEVLSVAPATELAAAGNVVILKTTDTKAAALSEGDTVTFKCRAQYEAIAAVREAETFNAEKLATWELDYCRLASPIVGSR